MMKAPFEYSNGAQRVDKLIDTLGDFEKGSYILSIRIRRRTMVR